MKEMPRGGALKRDKALKKRQTPLPHTHNPSHIETGVLFRLDGELVYVIKEIPLLYSRND